MSVSPRLAAGATAGDRDEITLEHMRETVAGVLGVEAGSLGDHDDLIRRGLDSVRIMSLANRWRRAGAQIRAAALFVEPTLAAWWLQAVPRTGALVDAAPQSEPRVVEQLDDPSGGGDPGPFDLTSIQHAYWVGRGDDQVLGGVGCHFYAEFDGVGVDPVRLDRAVRDLVRRHEMLRTRFLDDGRQQVMAPPDDGSSLTVITLDGLAGDVEDLLLAERGARSHRLLDVASGEVFAVTLVQMPRGRSRLLVNVDLLVADAQSIALFFHDLGRFYARGALPGELEPRTSVREWLRSDPDSDGEWSRARAYWHERLPDMPRGPELSLRVEPERIGTPRFERREIRLTPEERRRFEDRAHARGLTPASVLATAFAEILAGWSAGQRFLLSVPLMDRDTSRAGIERVVADFTNLVLVDVDLRDGLPFAEAAAVFQHSLHTGAAHSRYSGVEVVRDLARLDAGAPASAPVVFTSALGMGELYGPEFRDHLGEPGWMISQAPQVWLDNQVTERDGGIAITWDAVAELFPTGLLDDMFDAYAGLVRTLLDDAPWSVPVPSLLAVRQRHRRDDVNATAAHESGRLLHEGFFAWAGSDPDRPALISDDATVTYRELGERARSLAARLHSLSVRDGDLVAVTLPRGVSQVVAVLGILAAGGVYVPLGVDQPTARRARICATAGIRVAVTDTVRWSESLGLGVVQPVLVDVDEPPGELRSVRTEPADLAYVIYTSGSTGEPKGVMITHRAAVNTVEDVVERYAVGQSDRVLAVSALDFDLSVFDLFGLLGAGGAVVLIGESDRREAPRWAELVRRHGVTVWNSVPALLEMLLIASAELPPSLRLVMLSGDWIGLDLPARLRAARPGCRLVAMGGATEAAIWSNAFDVDKVPADWRSIPYGFPLRNQCYRVVDVRGRDCPDGVPGELWIGGVGVAAGYLGDPEMTARKFVVHDGGRWYRTGDRGRYHDDGAIEFLGRLDHQVKIRGHRIELGEVEAALTSHPAVAWAVLTVVRRPGAQLSAAVSLVPSAPSTGTDDLTSWVAGRVPAYMVPAAVVVLEQPPLTANGKVDRSAVAALLVAVEVDAPVHMPPGGEAEIVVAEIWSQLLGCLEVGAGDGFFALGGDSLLATRVVSRLREVGYDGADLPRLFAAPTLREFCAGLGRATDTVSRTEIVAAPRDRGVAFPLTDVQLAYWMGRAPDFTLGNVGSHWYGEFDGPLVDVARLEEAMNRLVARHGMLRAVVVDGGELQVLDGVPRLRIAETVVATDDAERAALDGLRDALSHQKFDTTRWPLCEIRAVHRHGRSTRLAMSFDYIVVDAMSIMLLLSELSTLYADPGAALLPVEVTFRDYVTQVRPDPASVEKARAYWLEQVGNLPPAPALPLAAAPAAIVEPRFSRRHAVLDAVLWTAITERARAHDLTPSSVLATAFAEVLSAWSGQEDMTLNLTLFDRRDAHPHIGRVLGDFTALLLVGHRPGGATTWRERAAVLQARIANDLEHSDVSALWVVRELARRRPGADVFLPVVFTSTLGVADELAGPTHSFGDETWTLTQTPQVWIDHQVSAWRGGLRYNWDCVDDLFPPGVLDAMFDAYGRLLAWLAAPDTSWSAAPPVLTPADQLARRGRAGSGDPVEVVAVEPGTLLRHPALRVLDGRGRECPDHVVGELHRASGGHPKPMGVRARHRGDGAVEVLSGPRAQDAVVPVVARGGRPDTRPPSASDPQIERRLAEVWTELLGLDVVERHENFVSLGGDSVLATRMVEMVRRDLHVEVSLREVFEGPTVAELAAVVVTHLSAELLAGPLEEGVI